jgi:chaperonin cofactor prefoldin
MDKTCKTISVKRAHQKLTKAGEDIEEDNAVCRTLGSPLAIDESLCGIKERLRKAIEDFSQRIIPLFEELELGRKRIQELEANQNTRFQDLTTKARRVDVLEREVVGLQRSKKELENNLSQSLDSAEAFRIRADDLQNRLTDVRRNLAAKEDEWSRAMDSLKRFKSSVCSCLAKKARRSIKGFGFTGHFEVKEAHASQTRSGRFNREVTGKGEYDRGTKFTHGRLSCPQTSPRNLTRDQDIGKNKLPPAPQSGLPFVHRHTKEEGWIAVDNNFQFEGMPAPGFKPSWGIHNKPTKKANTLLKKPQPSGSKADSKFPISLDSKGRPTIAVQIGPKNTLRALQRS